ncbi:MAG TPA: lamin tail domain-containing protein [Candidatus Paceibacterota bacterium]|nr:lamin tail domain-containing protein [Verrucomicrobiota bacterium]HRY48868.1 lamin tail domain-containing protein [Candidatus Paceibacterota bacterium]
MREIDRCSFWLWLLPSLALTFGVSGFGGPVISEFMAANDSGLADEEGEFSDWIEIYNPENVPISLAGYCLTDNEANPGKWTFPEVTLDSKAYLVVFASGKNRTDPRGRLHTDFRLSAEGEYLALIAPDRVTVASALAPVYPPQYENESFGLDLASSPPVWSFFALPTPGAPNANGTHAGPIIAALEPNPPQPLAGPLTIRAKVVPANDPVATVRLYYRRMFAAETLLPMTDNGTEGDAAAGDGIWSAVIPGDAFVPGEMTRWRFVATDTRGASTKEPAFRDPLDSGQYYGTVTRDDRIKTALPVLHWFTTNVSRADTLAGSRGAVYYEGEFYDNVLFALHGQSSSGFPKKSYNIDFNRTQRFRWSATAPRVADIDLLTNWADKSKARHVLAYEVMRRAGVAAHFAYTVRVQQNGSFFSTADMVEDADEIYLERAGLNRDGALYKVYNNLLNKDAGNTATSGVEKKTRRSENNTDLQALINGLDLTGQALETYLYDNIDIPRCVNMLAANSVVRNIDMHSKNWYIYRDTGRSGEWAILPWDLDLSHGRVWNTQNTYFDNALYTDGFVVTGTSIRLVAHLFQNPDIRAMILRRIGVLTDRFLQPPPDPGTPESELYYERRLNEQLALIDPPGIVPSDARLDFEKWGSWLQGGATVRYTSTNPAVETMEEAIQRWKKEYLPGRRDYIYKTQIVGLGGEIPLPQSGGGRATNFTPLVVKGAPVKVFVPSNGNLHTTWTGNPSYEPFNTTGWKSGTTGVGYERATGYEALIGANVDALMRSNNSVYIRLEFNVSDPAAFDRLQLRMKFDDGFAAYLNGALLVLANSPASPQWNSASMVSREANPVVFTVYDITDKIAHLRAGQNILAIQGLNDNVNSSDMIIVPELYAGKSVITIPQEPKIHFGGIEVSPPSGNQDEEYIQLLNPHSIAVDISDWRLTGGVEHTFAGGTVLPPNGAIYVCPNAAAFRARSASPKGGEGLLVQGGYQGRLSSLGETLALVDATGATNNTMAYPAQLSDAQRYLMISELMYQPSGQGLAEFIELLNISSTVTLDLRGVRFTQGVDFDFASGAIASLAPGARLLVVRDLDAFQGAYGTNRPVSGVFANGSALSNNGEVIRLEDANQDTIREFAYKDEAPWPAILPGYSLVLIAPETNPDPALAENWRPSARLGGTPGGPENGQFPADPMGDLNQNGERDLIDYALGNDLGLPSVTPQLILQPDSSGGPAALRLRYPIRLAAENVEITVSYSTDLSAWLDAAAYLEFVARESLDEAREWVIWRVKPPLRDEPRVFMRLQAVVEAKKRP